MMMEMTMIMLELEFVVRLIIRLHDDDGDDDDSSSS